MIYLHCGTTRGTQTCSEVTVSGFVTKKSTSSTAWKALLVVIDALIRNLDSESNVPVLLTSNGKYDNKLIYDSLRPHEGDQLWNRYIQGKMSTPRTSFVSWMIISKGVLLKDKLKQFGVVQNDGCDLCNGHQEN